MENSRLNMLPEDCQRLIWSKVYGECLKEIETESLIFWDKKLKNQIHIDTDLFYRYCDNEDEDDKELIELYTINNKLLTSIGDFVNDLRKKLKSKIVVYNYGVDDSDFEDNTPFYTIEPYNENEDKVIWSSDDEDLILSSDDE